MGGQRLRSGITFLKHVWRLAFPYFKSSEERWRARLLLAAVVILTLVQVLMQVQLNSWYQDFYTTLQTKDLPSFVPLLGRFLVIAFIFIFAGVQENYWQEMLQMRWRVWLTHRFVGSWLARKAYYRLQVEGLPTDNPDQRISEDLNQFTSGNLDLGLGIVQSIITLISFVVILWNISPTLTVPLGDP